MENTYELYNACVEKDLKKIEVILGGMKKTSKAINNILIEILSNSELNDVSSLLLKKLKKIKRVTVQEVMKTKNAQLILLASKCDAFYYHGMSHIYELDLDTFTQVFANIDIPERYYLHFEFAANITLENLKYLIEECGLDLFSTSHNPHSRFALLGYCIEMGRIDIVNYLMDVYTTQSGKTIETSCNCGDCDCIEKDDTMDGEKKEVSKNEYYPIYEQDDILKKTIKDLINKNGFDKEKFKSVHAYNNMRSQLTKDSKMSVTYFNEWCDILGVDVDIKVSTTSDKE